MRCLIDNTFLAGWHWNLAFKLPCPAGTIVVNTNKPAFCIYAKRKAQISCATTAQLISALLRYIDRTIPLQPKSEFQASNHLLWFVSDLVRKPKDGCCLYNVLFKQPLVIIHG